LNFNITDNQITTTANQQHWVDDQYNHHLSTTTNQNGLIFNTTNNKKSTTVNHNQQGCIDHQYNQQRSNTIKRSTQSTTINHNQQWTTNDIRLIVNATNNGQSQPKPTSNNKLERRIELQYNRQPNNNNGQQTTFG